MTACACCLSALQSRFVSRFGRARADDRFAVRATFFARSMFGSCRSPRATAPRELCGDCYVGGTLLPAWTFTSGIASPAFTMAATERERFAAGGSVLLLYGPRACHLQQCNVSHLKEALLKLVEQRRGVTSRTTHPSEPHSTPARVLGSVRVFRTHDIT